MIMVKVGDKVRFLNAVGGGIVRRIDRDVVLVEEEDGFETPVLARECVVIESGRKQDNDIVPTDKQEIARSTARQVAPQPADDDDEPELPLVETRKGERVSLYLAFVPESCSRLGSTTFDAYLINDSNYYLDYLYAGSDETGEWTMYSRGTVECRCISKVSVRTRSTVSGVSRYKPSLTSAGNPMLAKNRSRPSYASIP